MNSNNFRCLSAYLCIDKDYHKDIKISKNNYDYIKEYYESILKHNLDATIIVDDMSINFMKKFTTDKINFYNVKPKNNKMLIHDERFYYFLKMVKYYKNTEYFLISDISDVIIINNPEKILCLSKDKLYVCKENENIDLNKWFSNYLDKINFYKYYKSLFNNKLLLNCGGIFGHRTLIIKLLKRMIIIMRKIYSENKNLEIPLDMFVFNYIIYKCFKSNISLNDNFNTKFGHYEFDNTKVIKHK